MSASSVSYSFGPQRTIHHKQTSSFNVQNMSTDRIPSRSRTASPLSLNKSTFGNRAGSFKEKRVSSPSPVARRPTSVNLSGSTVSSNGKTLSPRINENQSAAMIACWRNVHGTSPGDSDCDTVDGKVSPDGHMALGRQSPSMVEQRDRSSTCPEFKRSQSVKVNKLGFMTDRKHFDSADLEKSSSLNDLKTSKKTAADSKISVSRQRSNPIPRQNKNHEDDVKRHSMPQSRRNTYSMLEKIVQSDSNDTVQEVPELFQCIRGATQRDLFEEMEKPEPEPPKATYEVMYVGKARVKNKRVLSRHIDDLVTQLEAKEAGLTKGTQGSDRRRHKSDSSIKSLPSTLDEGLVKENELQKISHKSSFIGTELHNDSPTGSNDDMLKHDSSDRLSEEHSSSENLTNFGLSSSGSGDQLRPMMVTALHHHPEDQLTDLHQGVTTEGHGQDGQDGNPQRTRNTTMLFQIGQHEISLISLDNKRTIIERKFKIISSVSQGSIKSDVFGFISRETGNQLICHLLRCCSSEIVDEIMQQIQTSFHNAFQLRQQQLQQICINCPLQQFHKLSQEVNGMCPESSYKLLCSRIEQLPEKEATELYQSLQHQNPQCYEESVEALMIGLRKMCEHKQREHSHISDANKGMHKCDIFLVDMKGRSNSKPNAFDFIAKKARKKLTTSFENLMTNVQHKRDEVREAFRHRSATSDSEGGSFSRSVDESYGPTPELSPAPSPAIPIKDQVTFDFPSPPPSPTNEGRPRSSTVGAVPDSKVLGSITARQEERQKAELKEQEKKRASESPMKHMFILANASSPRRSSDHLTVEDDEGSSHLSPHDALSPLRRGSWRQAIFNRVVTPSRNPKTPTLEECLEEGRDSSHVCTKSREEIRALWRKAILETLLLIRMEKENIDLRARQDEMHLKRQKLDYVEITPCLKEVSRLWDEMLNCPDRTMVKFDQQKLLNCVKMGVPQSKRGEVWGFLVEQHRLHHPGMEDQSPKLDYTDLLKQLTTHQHAILIDLGRTFPGHPYFSMQLGNGQLALFNLLKAYSLMDQEVGYCQGLSFVAGILLMHMEETVAFEVWEHVMYNLGLRKQYRPNMIALQIQLYQLTRLIHDNYKDLYDHFEEHEIAPTLYAAPWFLTLFASQFPLGFVGRVFDLIFVQGIDVIFKVALVLLGNHKELILQCNSFETIVEFIKTTLPEMGMIQMERVINQVFGMELGKQLQAYEVEYHVLKEEMMYSPTKGDKDLLDKLEGTNRSLRQQNMELIEKLQHAHSHERSLESLIHKYQTQETKLKSHIRTLELERGALLNAVAKLKHCIPAVDQLSLDLTLPAFTPNMPVSPVHHGKGIEVGPGVRGGQGQKSDVIADTGTQSKNKLQTGTQ